MLCKRFLGWLSRQNYSSLELSTLTRLHLFNEKRLFETKTVCCALRTARGLTFLAPSGKSQNCNSHCFYHTNATVSEKGSSAAGVTPLDSRKNRIIRENAEEIERVVEEHFDKVERFANALGCTATEMKSLVRMDTRIVTAFEETKVLGTIKYLKQYGFSSSEVLSNPPAFCLSLPTLVSRLKQMDEVRCRRLYILKFGPQKFNEMLEFYEEERRIMKGFLSKETYLAALFGVDETDIYDAWEKHPHLENYSAARLTAAINVLQEYGYSRDDVWDFPEALILPLPDLKERLDRMNAAGLLDKTEVFRHLYYHAKGQFDTFLSGWIDDQIALQGHNDKISFLCSRLNSTPAEIESILKRYKTLDMLRPKRWKKVLDVLLDEMEIPTKYVVNSPTILLYSAERLRYRHKILNDHYITEPSVVIANLRLSKINFEKKFKLKEHNAEHPS